MPKPVSLILCAVLTSASLACSLTARTPERYRDDTATLLETKRSAIKTCYDAAVRAQSGSAGEVTVRFRVEQESGRIHEVLVDPSRTTAPEPVSACVVREVEGLVLSPGDARDGEATFVWTFTVRSATGDMSATNAGRHGS